MEIEARIRSRFQGQGPIPPAALVGRPPRTNSSSIAEVTGIPRETVRRKLEALARRGWVERDADGLWHIKPDGPNTVSARRDLIDIDRRQMDRVSRYLGQMHAMAVETQARPAIDPLTQLSPANSPGEVA